MVMFNSYVKLPEVKSHTFHWVFMVFLSFSWEKSPLWSSLHTLRSSFGEAGDHGEQCHFSWGHLWPPESGVAGVCYISIHVYIYIFTWIYIYISMYIYIHGYIYIQVTEISIDVWIQYLHMHIYIYIFIYFYMHMIKQR